MDDRTEQERRWDLEQALASARIEGFDPPPEFLVDCERVARGEMSVDDLLAANLKRAVAADRAAAAQRSVPDAA